MKANKNILITALLIVISVMSIGYSAFATELDITGTAEIVGEWNVRIANIQAISISDDCDAGQPEYTDTTALFNAKLQKPGDSITYEITIENAGTIDAALDYASFNTDKENGSPAIEFCISDPPDELKAGNTATFTIVANYKEEVTELPSIKTKTIVSKLFFKQK